MAKIRQLDGRDEVIEWVTGILRQAGRSFEPPQGGRIAATALLAVADDVIE
jgi:hypothetical protein